MNSEFDSLIRYFLYGGDIPQIENWEQVFSTFASHGLLQLAGTEDRISALIIPDELSAQWSQHIFAGMLHYRNILQAETELTELLEQYGTKPVIIKGTSAAQYYPDPMFRTNGDIDFMVRGEKNAKKVQEIMLANGYEPDGQQDDEAYHTSYRKDGVHFELHAAYSHKGAADPSLMAEALAPASIVPCGGAYAYEDLQNGLILLEHVRGHLKEGIGFRQILDFQRYTDKVLTDDFWNERFSAEAERLGDRSFAIHLVRMCEMHFGLSEHAFAKEADEQLCEDLYAEILGAGNFGWSRGQTVSKMAQVRKNKRIFHRLQRGGLAHWRYSWTHKWVRPFAWLYQLIRIAGIVLREKNLKKAFAYSEQKFALLKRLGLE